MSTKLTIYRLIFRSPLHVGEDVVGPEKVSSIVHSDTILSALYSLALKVNGDISTKIAGGAVRISSASPFYRDNNDITYYFPKPIIAQEKVFPISEADYPLRKKLKKLNFIPLDWILKIINGETIEVTAQEIENIKEKLKKLFKTHTIPKVALDRITQDSNLFHFGELHFSKGGLFIIADFKDEDMRSAFEGLLKFLGDEGLGGKRTAGYGLFDVETDSFEINLPENPSKYLLLSLYWPSTEERYNLNLKESSYQLIRRTGWFLLNDGRSLKRRPLWMFKEGSILNKEPFGGAADVTPDSLNSGRVYRFGYALSLPMAGSDAE